MPHESGQSVRAFPVSDVNRYKSISKEDQRTQEEKELQFRNKLLDYGLDEISTNLLTLKFVYNWTFQESCEYLNIEIPLARKLYTNALETLKKRGYRG